MSREIDYGNLMHDAMRGLIRKVLLDVADRGLPGNHHFFITFDTAHPDAELADWLSDRYPGEMTVVMQHWYDGLEVTDEGFSVTLNFGDAPEPLYIPYDAIRTFVDPSVEFGLRFEQQEGEDAGQSDLPAPEVKAEETDTQSDGDIEESKDAEIVSLDSFRK
ncbi:MAG: SspB family protein [Sulfitobacter sp.]